MLVGEDAFRNILEVADGTLISPATAADLLDQAVLETMLFDGPSRVLDLGHQRSFVGAARRAVEVVHRTCTGEGCHVRSDALRDRPHPPLRPSAAPPSPTTAGPNAAPTTANTTGPPQPHRDHHPRPTTTTASPAPPTSNSPGPASATACSTTPPGERSPPTAGRSRRGARLPAMTNAVTVHAVLRNRARVRGAERWIDELPERIAALESAWSLRAGPPYESATEAYVAPATLADGTAAVLKILLPWPGGPVNHEPTVLRLAGGNGLVRLLRHDEAHGALAPRGAGAAARPARGADDPPPRDHVRHAHAVLAGQPGTRPG